MEYMHTTPQTGEGDKSRESALDHVIGMGSENILSTFSRKQPH